MYFCSVDGVRAAWLRHPYWRCYYLLSVPEICRLPGAESPEQKGRRSGKLELVEFDFVFFELMKW